MPTLQESSTKNLDMSNYTPVTNEASPSMGIPAPSVSVEPGINPFMRCPLPSLGQTDPDSQRQFYKGSSTSQTRFFTPPAPAGGSGTYVTNNYSNSSNSSSGSGGGSSSGGSGGSITGITVTQASLVAASLGPGGKFSGSITLSKSFQLLGLTASAPCRIQIYGSRVAQLGDLYRGLDVTPPAGSTQNIITDVVLDTSPYTWTFQDRMGSNGESPVTARVYVTITNLDITTDNITVGISYVPLATS